MKKYLLIFLLGFSSFYIKAQDGDPARRAEKIQALKIAFITQKLDLSIDEAQKFWPVYNHYESDMKQLIKDNKNSPDVIEGDEKLLNLRKRYKGEFIKVIGQPKMNRLFNAEKEFRGVLLKNLKNRNLQRPKRQ
jgi:hypothetical protein